MNYKYIILFLSLFVFFYTQCQEFLTFHNKTGEFLMFFVYFKDLNRYGSYKDTNPNEIITIPIKQDMQQENSLLNFSITIKNPLLGAFFQIISIETNAKNFEIIRREEHKSADGDDWKILEIQ